MRFPLFVFIKREATGAGAGQCRRSLRWHSFVNHKSGAICFEECILFVGNGFHLVGGDGNCKSPVDECNRGEERHH